MQLDILLCKLRKGGDNMETKNTYPELLTTPEVEKILKMHKVTVLRLIRFKKLKAFKVGNRWRFLRSDIDEYIEKKQEEYKLN